MIKLNLKHPSGLEVSFEGDPDTLDRFVALLRGELGDFVNSLESRPTAGVSAHEGGSGGQASSPRTPAQASQGDGTSLDPRTLADRFEQVNAKTDIERITVIAQAAVEAKREGLDHDTADRIYLDLGLKRPPKWRATFSNARTRGYLQNIGRNTWKPTVAGQNFALLGERAPARKRARRSTGGGEND